MKKMSMKKIMKKTKQFFSFMKEEHGIGVVEVILILVGICTP